MRKKVIFLFLALALPGLVFLFLKRFGKNEFAIPVYFTTTTAIDSVNKLCRTTYVAPYHVPDSILVKTEWRAGLAALFVFDSLAGYGNEFNRVRDSFTESELQTIIVTSPTYAPLVTRRWKTCVFLSKPNDDAVLIDRENQIRGYYRLSSREESDRLILELEILLKKY